MHVVTPSITLRGSVVSFHQPWVMGILNLTPDSFHDGGAWNNPAAALGQAERMLDEGADMLDLGAQSTRPGAEELGPEAEWQRLEPVLVALKKTQPDAIVSVDTFHAEVARRALAEGADVINDVSGGDADPDMWAVVAQARAPYVLMHMQGTPTTMQDNPTYDDVVHEVVTHLQRRVHAAYQAGVTDVVADVGFGFGKTVAHNYALLDALDQFHELQCPLLAGVSRKSMIQKVLGVDSQRALNGTTALHAWALDRGAHILRVHDVAEAKEAVALHQALVQSRIPDAQ
ncbi:MAG: dihydropteroate synthase [Crocinitomicaceae bacterium]|nr:dihydropteroate synthase [Crocinitomicaceae bacterium]